MTTQPIKLKKTEFFDIYGISLLLNKKHDTKLLKIIIPIAKKYIKITENAVKV